MEDKIDETIKCNMKKNQESSQVDMRFACYATMVKKAAATSFTTMICRFVWQSLVLASRYFIWQVKKKSPSNNL